MNNDSVLKKEFKKSDVERVRNLVKKDFTSSTKIQTGYKKSTKRHKEGDIWQEDGKEWTIKNGIKQNITKLDSAKKATRIMDNIFADPDYFLEVSRRYNRDPINPVLQENMITALTSGIIKTVNTETDAALQPSSDQQMEELLGYQ